MNTTQIKKLTTWLAIGLICSLISHYLIELIYFNFDFERVHSIIFEQRTELFLLGSMVILIIYSLFSFLIGSSVVGAVLTLLTSGSLGVITKLKAIHRAEPFFPNEIYMIREFPFLVEMIGNRTLLLIVSIISMSIAGTIFYLKIRKKTKMIEYSISSFTKLRTAGVILSILTLLYIGRFNYPNNIVKEKYNNYAGWVTYHQNKNYTENGFIAGFLSNMPAPGMKLPSNYSEQKLNEIVEKYKEKANEINKERLNQQLDTNVLFVMNESFSDPLLLNGVTSNKDPLPYYRELMTQSLNGLNKSPGYGGGTATSEFQVLTTFSVEPLEPHVTSPYIQLTSQITNFPTVTNRFKANDYELTAIHPFDPSFYRRNNVYQYMGFDTFLNRTNMEYREKVSAVHRYISDHSAYQEVFKVMEQSERLDFIHLVTMQNHMQYANKYEYVDFEVKGTGNPDESEAYFKDIENSDLALQLLINRIDESTEPIVLVFWGDHLPSFYDPSVFDNNSDLSKFETPFFIYSNEKDFNEELETISPIYFINHVWEILNQEITPYEAMLLELEEVLPVIDNGLYYDNIAKKYVHSREKLSPEALRILQDYTTIMYDVVSERNSLEDLEFFE